MTETISRIMFARRRDAEPDEPEVAATAADRPAPEGA
jgi:hypothetical protein